MFVIKISMNEQEKEKELLYQMTQEKFNAKECIALRWLIFNIRSVPNFPTIKDMCLLLSKIIGIPLYREHYRRKTACLYWLEKNLNIINKYISENNVVVHCSDKNAETQITMQPYYPQVF